MQWPIDLYIIYYVQGLIGPEYIIENADCRKLQLAIKTSHARTSRCSVNRAFSLHCPM
jgi:hypothetical protein